jgi:hypothetical protein
MSFAANTSFEIRDALRFAIEDDPHSAAVAGNTLFCPVVRDVKLAMRRRIQFGVAAAKWE